MAAAQELFFKHGMIKTSIAEIAKKAQVSQVTIYNYFGSKDNLMREVLHQYMSRAIEAAEEILLEQVPFEQKIERLFSLKMDNYSPLSRVFLESIAWDDPSLQKFYKEIAETKALPFMKRFIEQGKESGAIHPSITWEAGMAYISAVMTILTQPDFLKSSDEYKMSVNRLFYYGLIGK